MLIKKDLRECQNTVNILVFQHVEHGQWCLRPNRQGKGRLLSGVLDWLKENALYFQTLLGPEHSAAKPTNWDVLPPKYRYQYEYISKDH